jgi:5'-nucleotidase
VGLFPHVLWRTPLRRSRLSLAAALAVTSSAVLVGVPAVAEAAPKQIPVQLLTMNDFHGRIAETSGGDSQIITGPGDDGIYGPNAAGVTDDKFLLVGGSAHIAATVDRLQAAFAGESFFVGAGDLISASTFESSFFKDEPTIEALNAMGLDVSAVGNHEFDRGTQELRRISGATDDIDGVTACEGITVGVDGCFGNGDGHDFHGTDFPYLAANVLSKETGQPMLPPYEILDIDGRAGDQRMAVIGVVTDTTPTIVSPDGITDVEFIDEADAVNRYAAELKQQGIKAIAVLVHEGGEVDSPAPAFDQINACANLRGPIVDINNRVDEQVDVIISAHSHQAYNCMLTDPAGQPRLVTQAGFYGRLVTDIRLTVNSVSGEVDRSASSYGAANVPVVRAGTGDAEVASIVQYWKDRAAVAGSVVVGRQTADLDRAYRSGRAVRDRESSLGNLIADAQLAAAKSSTVLGGGDLAIMNPGGIRADINCAAPAGSTQANGDITFAETFEVQPFSNTVNAVNLTGAAIEQILEQQWAVRGGSLSFLQLSVSSNVRFEFDPNAPVGARIDPAKVTVNGVPLDLGGAYRVVANSFLIGGGDSFTAFRDGRVAGSTPVTGPNDVDAFNAYLVAQQDRVAPPALNRAVSTDPAQPFDDDRTGTGACVLAQA